MRKSLNKIEENLVKNKNELINLEIHEKSINCLVVHNNLLISGSNDKTIKITDWNYYKTFKTLKFHKDSVNCFLIYDNYLISGSKDKLIIITNWNNYEIINTLNIHFDSISCFTNYENLLISGSNDKTIKITNLNNYKLIKSLEIHNEYIISLKAYNNLLLSASDDKLIKITNLKNYENIKILEIHEDYINCLTTFKELLFSGSDDSLIKITNLYNYENIKILNIHNDCIRSLKIYIDFLISGSNDETIKITNIYNYENIKTLKIHKNIINTLYIYNDLLITGSKDNWIKITYLKKNPNIIYVSNIWYYYYEKLNIQEKIKTNFNCKSLFNLINTNNNNLNSIIFNYYFNIQFNIIKKTENINLFEESLKYFGYDLLFNYNSEDNLLNLIIKEKKVKIFLKPIINYFIINNIYHQINYDQFIKILNIIKNDNILFDLLLTYIYKESLTDNKIKNIKLIYWKNNIIFKSNYNILKNELFNKKININKNFDLNEYKIYNYLFKIPISLSKNKKLFSILNEATNEIKLSDLKYFINYFFKRIFYFKFFNLFIFIIKVTSLIISLNLNDNISKIIYLISIIYFIFYEIIQLSLNWKYYYKNLNNYFDISLIIYNLFVFYNIFINKYKGMNLIIMILFYLNGFKLLNFLKSIEFIRKQIRLFIKVLISTFQFIIFIFIILFYLSIINFLFNFNKINNLKFSIFNVYGMMLGSFDDNYIEFQIKDFIELFINTYFFNIILLNLFISIISDIFNNYNQNKELYDIEEKISILLEYSSIFIIFENFNLIKKIKNKLKTKVKNFNLVNNYKEAYFFIIKRKVINNNDLNKKIENMNWSLNYKIDELNNKMNSLDLKINNKLTNIENLLKNLSNN